MINLILIITPKIFFLINKWIVFIKLQEESIFPQVTPRVSIIYCNIYCFIRYYIWSVI